MKLEVKATRWVANRINGKHTYIDLGNFIFENIAVGGEYHINDFVAFRLVEKTDKGVVLGYGQREIFLEFDSEENFAPLSRGMGYRFRLSVSR